MTFQIKQVLFIVAISLMMQACSGLGLLLPKMRADKVLTRLYPVSRVPTANVQQSLTVLIDRYLQHLAKAAPSVVSDRKLPHSCEWISLGNDNYRCSCPFHRDNTPSLHASNSKGVFHCFSCEASGNIIKFIELTEKCSRSVAIERLHEIDGLPQELREGLCNNHYRNSAPFKVQEYDVRLVILEKSANFYQSHLLSNSPKSRKALEYLQNRKICNSTIAAFGIGYSDMNWQLYAMSSSPTPTQAESTANSMRTRYNQPVYGDYRPTPLTANNSVVSNLMFQNFSLSDIASSGILASKQNADNPNSNLMYERFRSRLIFPIKTADGAVVGFGGRRMSSIIDPSLHSVGKPSPRKIYDPKYLNSGESEIFKKGELWYGLDVSKEHIIRTRAAVVVEGYFDVISCSELGVTNVVGSLGTGLNLGRLATLHKLFSRTGNRYASIQNSKIVLLMDNDDAGLEAASRVCQLLLSNQHNTTISEMAIHVASMESLRNYKVVGNESLAATLQSTIRSIKDASDLLVLIDDKQVSKDMLRYVIDHATDWKIFVTERILSQHLMDFTYSDGTEVINLMADVSNVLRVAHSMKKHISRFSNPIDRTIVADYVALRLAKGDVTIKHQLTKELVS